jgi:two-component system chemotaxis response regulator CheY
MPAILTVDDSRLMRRIIGSVIESLGYSALEACNGLEGLNIVENSPDEILLVLLDVNMPVMDGFVTLQRLKSDTRYESIPVIMVTTEAERENIIRAIRLGAANYVTKPFTSDELACKILESLEV